MDLKKASEKARPFSVLDTRNALPTAENFICSLGIYGESTLKKTQNTV